MPLVPAKCTNCGASLQIDNTQQAAICPYCHSAYVVEQAINNYNYNVIVKDESSIDAKVENATTFLKVFKEYEKARQIFGSITDVKSSDYRGWWGLVQVDTREFTVVNCTRTQFQRIERNAARAFSVASPEVRQFLQTQWNEYLFHVKNHVQQKAQEQNLSWQNGQEALSRRQNMKNQLMAMEQAKNTMIKQKDKYRKKLDHPMLPGFAFGGLMLLVGIYGGNVLGWIIGIAMIAGLAARWLNAKSVVNTMGQQIAQLNQECAAIYQEIAGTDTQIEQLNQNIQNLQEYIF